MAPHSRGRSYRDDMSTEKTQRLRHDAAMTYMQPLQPESETHDVSKHVAAASRSYGENTLLAEHVAA